MRSARSRPSRVKVEHRVSQLQMDREIGVAFQEARQPRHHVCKTEGIGRRHTERSCGMLRETCHGDPPLLEIGDDAFGIAEVDLTSLGETLLASRSSEEHLPQPAPRGADTWRETAEGVTPSLRAAREKLPSRAAMTKICRCGRSAMISPPIRA